MNPLPDPCSRITVKIKFKLAFIILVCPGLSLAKTARQEAVQKCLEQQGPEIAQPPTGKNPTLDERRRQALEKCREQVTADAVLSHGTSCGKDSCGTVFQTAKEIGASSDGTETTKSGNKGTGSNPGAKAPPSKLPSVKSY